MLAVADQDRPEISVLSDEFLESIAAKTEHPNVQIRLLEKLLKGEVQSRQRTSQAQAKRFSEQIEQVLRRYELRQISSAEVVQRLVEIAKSLRDARRRHEQLGLSVEEAAFYDALAGGSSDSATDPQIAKIAAETGQEHQGRPHRRLGRPRVHRGEDPHQDQTPAAKARLQAVGARRGWGR